MAERRADELEHLVYRVDSLSLCREYMKTKDEIRRFGGRLCLLKGATGNNGGEKKSKLTDEILFFREKDVRAKTCAARWTRVKTSDKRTPERVECYLRIGIVICPGKETFVYCVLLCLLSVVDTEREAGALFVSTGERERESLGI